MGRIGMSKKDELTFTVKQSLVVGTVAGASMLGSACGTDSDSEVISNPVPSRDAGTVQQDTGGNDTGSTQPDGAETSDAADEDEQADGSSSDTADGE